MSRVTLAHLRDTNVESFRAAARAWEALAARLDTAYERFLTGQRRVDEVGRGEAITAASWRMLATSHEVSGLCLPARRVAQALHEYADEVTTLQRYLDSALTSARSLDISIDLHTTAVAAPAAPPQPMDPYVWRVYIDEVRAELERLLARARRLDESTSKHLRSHQPAPGYGFGRERAWQVDRAMIEAQIGRPPSEVYAWWQGLEPEQQEWVLADHPDLVGSLDGIPAADRDKANRLNLDNQLRSVREQAAAVQYLLDHPGADPFYREPHHPQDDQFRRHELARLLSALRTSEAGLVTVQEQLARHGDAYLLLIDGAGDGRVAIALGNPDHAAHTAVFVPGAATDLQDVGGDLTRALRLRQTADGLTLAPGDVSAVYWLGYDPPDSAITAFVDGPSHDGGAALRPFVDGLRVTHTPGDHHVTAVGHSYGTTVVAEAAKGGLRIDDFVAVGSPGLRSDHVSELNLAARHVWVGLAGNDPITWAPDGFHGPEPYDPAYGARRFETGTSGHSGYWETGSESLLNQARVIAGQYDQVSLVPRTQPA